MFLLVGAPKANTSQSNVVEGGQVLQCNWNSNRNCQPIIFDSTGNVQFAASSFWTDKKSRLGLSMSLLWLFFLYLGERCYIWHVLKAKSSILASSFILT